MNNTTLQRHRVAQCTILRDYHHNPNPKPKPNQILPYPIVNCYPVSDGVVNLGNPEPNEL